jgi:BRCT domain type II-containing protein
VAGDFATSRKTVTDLITHWGGAVDPSVTPQTTYLILGAPPAGAERQAYDAARSQAEQFKIPIVSEERFNLLIRYYDPQKH